MTTTDWIIDIALIALVLRQIREERLSLFFLLAPIGIVTYVASHYLHALPTAGNDLVLTVVCLAVGLGLGVAGGLTTRVRIAEGNAYVRAGRTAASIWIASMTARLLFIVFITHSAGQSWLVHFSAAHDITSADAWQDGLVILALAEVTARFGLILFRAQRGKAAARAAARDEVGTRSPALTV